MIRKFGRPKDLAEYVQRTVNFELHDWQRRFLCPLLERLCTEKGVRILVHAPPQYGKSIIASQRLIAYILGMRPAARVGLACFNLAHAVDFGALVKQLMQEPNYRKWFPDPGCRLSKKDPSAEKFTTVARRAAADGQFSFFALGLQTGFVGKGADVLIIDDPYASAEDAESESTNEHHWQWWNQTARPRIMPEANVLVMFHRWHKNDFAGRLMKQGGWEYHRFPAIMDENKDGSDRTDRVIGDLLSPIRSRDSLAEEEHLNPLAFAGLYQGTPKTASGTFIKSSDFRYMDWEDCPLRDRVDLSGEVIRADWFRGWDLATSVKQRADRSAGVLIGVDRDGTIYIRDVWLDKKEYPDLKAEIIRIATEVDPPGTVIGIEKKFTGLAMVQDLMQEPAMQQVAIYGVEAKGDKKQRAQVWASRAREKRLVLIRGEWNQRFVDECLNFEGRVTDEDDQIDATSVATELVYDTTGGIPSEEMPPAPGTLEFYRQCIHDQRKESEDQWNADWNSGRGEADFEDPYDDYGSDTFL